MDVRVAVYDALGRRVQVLVDERTPAGRHTVQWNGRDASGRALASGLYFIRLRAGDQQHIRRLTLVR
jgi:flagellar hook assembly protein FlgD